VPDIFTIGHSTHEPDAFLALLRRHEIALVADVRTIPRSRRVAHFNVDVLPGWLAAAGVQYRHLVDLGGRRKASPTSPNTGWQHPSFRGYADHMSTPAFATALAELEELAHARRVAYMCAEGLWWRCHRRMISDALVARAWHVRHIMPDGDLAEHRMTPFAVIGGLRVTYPAPQGSLEV
jgi:uncharacterized protein (DUF488 family)